MASFFLPPTSTTPRLENEPNGVETSNSERPASYQDREMPTSDIIGHISPIQPSIASHTSIRGEIMVQDPQRGSDGASRATTYFTWSPSHTRSPCQPEKPATHSHQTQESLESKTPNSVRKVLVESGIYRGTGIAGYDDPPNKPDCQTELDGHTTNHVLKSDRSENGEGAPISSPCQSSQNVPAMQSVSLASLLGRWRMILPAEWLIDRDAKLPKEARTQLDIPELKKQQRPVHKASGYTEDGTTRTNRQRIAEETRLDARPTRVNTPKRIPSFTPTNTEPCQATESIPAPQPSSSTSRASVTSRDAMPPPPIPLDKQVRPPTQSMRLTPEEHFPVAHEPASKTNDDNKLRTEGGTQRLQFSASSKIPGVNYQDYFSHHRRNPWIPENQTLASTPMVTRIANTSNTSTTHPLRLEQATRTIPGHGIEFGVPRALFHADSMAGCISRIEHETEHQGFEVLPNESAVYSIEQLDSGSPLYGLHRSQAGHEDQLVIPPQRQTHYMISNRDESENQHALEPDERVDIGGVNDWNSSSPLLATNHTHDGIEGIARERSEMSSFWRPNRFMQF